MPFNNAHTVRKGGKKNSNIYTCTSISYNIVGLLIQLKDVLFAFFP